MEPAVLELGRELCESVADFDHCQRTVSVDAYAPFPLGELTPVIQECNIQMALTAELIDDERLLSGLRSRIYQLAMSESLLSFYIMDTIESRKNI